MTKSTIPARYLAKTSKKCKTCLYGRNNPKFRDRVYKAWFERQPGEETLEQIGKEFGISNQAIYRHAHNHMKKRMPKLTDAERYRQNAQIVKAEAMRDLEVSFDHSQVVPVEAYEQAVDDVITEGIAQLRVKKKDVTINQLLAAAKIKGDWALKKRGQNTELIKTMFRSANGLTKEPGNVAGAGSDWPGNICRETSGDESPPRPEEIPPASSQETK